MTEEEKKAAELAKAAEAEKAKAERDAESDEDKAKREAEEARVKQIEADLALEKERREKAEKALADAAFKTRQAKRDEEEEEEETEDKPLTQKDLLRVLDEREARSEKKFQETEANRIAEKLSSSEAEKSLLVETWKNRTLQGSLEEQMEEALAIINRKRIVAQNAELKRALLSKETAGKGSADAERESPGAGEPKISAFDQSAIKMAGMVWDSTKRLYKKPLMGGKLHLYYDPKTQKRWKAQ